MTRPTVLVAHERGAIASVAARVLTHEGFAPTQVADGRAAAEALARTGFDALVVDVGLPGIPGYELAERARALRDTGRGARVVILVASVYRATSYKRRPSRLYGADDYVELHHIGDALAPKLRRLLALPETTLDAETVRGANEAVRREGDRRLESGEALALAKLIVADVVLYNGEGVLGSRDLAGATDAVGGDLDVARDLFTQLVRGRSPSAVLGDPIGEAFRELMFALGRVEARP